MLYTYKWNDDNREYEIYSNGKRIITDSTIRDREDLLIELEKLSPCMLIIERSE